MMGERGPIGQIRVEVAPGPTRSKRWISFTACGGWHALVVDARDVIGGALWVAVIEERGEQTIIEIPASSMASFRISMPTRNVARVAPPPDRSGLATLGSLLLHVIRWALTR